MECVLTLIAARCDSSRFEPKFEPTHRVSATSDLSATMMITTCTATTNSSLLGAVSRDLVATEAAADSEEHELKDNEGADCA